MQEPGSEQGAQHEGLRARKRRQTRQRIIDAGLRLFVSKGYDATTLDAIAEAADISRRTYFSYFASKDDLLLAWQDDAIDDLRAALVDAAAGRTALDAARAALSAVIGRFETADFIAIDDLMRSTEILRDRKQGSYERLERALFAAMLEVWPQEDRRSGLRMTAMVAIGALRLALETWREDGRVCPIGQYLDAAFEALKTEV
jgi:AcrR family transcriptional regulator